MEIVGYNNDYAFTDHLVEATITCNYNELKEIAAFINKVIEEHSSDESQICLHLRDFVKDWDKSSSDLIVLIP
ncbi:hypothetical protein [Ruminococcus sp.]|uniref:hypothetical protein n=1 Tax=Ruminococcus sp. TaxID=41978 RepID=UPI0025E60D3F|nr:hypothetical protein [Ruminococcus sp.]